ncbi:type VI secretion system-associated protein TagF [soil metagenome]
MKVGFFGKLPGQADFVGRGLTPAVQAAVDDWLAGCLQRLQTASPADWLARYLASPSWRFVWMADATAAPLRGETWAGALLPSVDSVGRYFPLLLLANVPPDCELPALLSWLEALDALGAQALDEDWQPDALMAALPAPPASSGLPATDINAMLGAEARQVWLAANRGSCFWLCAAEAYQTRWLRSEGLTDEGLDAALFGLAGLTPAAASQ